MNKKLRLAFINLLAIPLLINIGFAKEHSESVYQISNTQNDTTSITLSSIVTRSEEISNDMSQVIGVSISPLLGMGVLCAYNYLKTPEVERAQLSWYNSPKFWIPLLIILLLIISKDFLTSAIPILQPLKKPLDAAENFENIISALIAMPIVLSLLANISSEFLSIISTNVYANTQTPTQFQIVNAGIMSYFETILLVIVGAIGFVLVWLASHSINVLILLSPFGIVDLLLRLVRLFIIGVLVASTAIHPFLGLIFCLILIFIGYRISGWSFRIMVFGTVFSADLLTRRSQKLELDPNEIKAFSNKAVPNVPPRTYGFLKKSDDSSIEFVYKPWLIKPACSISLSDISTNYEIGMGLINPVLLKVENERNSYTVFFRLPPRYKSHEEEIANILGIKSIREVGVTKGLRAIRQWIAENVKTQSIILRQNA